MEWPNGGVLGQGDQAHPEQAVGVSGFDIVLTDVGQSAVLGETVNSQAGRYRSYFGAFAQQVRNLVRGYQDAPAGVERKGARAHPMGIGVLQQRGLTGLLIDGIDGDGVFASYKDLLTLEIDGVTRAVALIDDAPIGMNVNGGSLLPGVDMGRGQRGCPW